MTTYPAEEQLYDEFDADYSPWVIQIPVLFITGVILLALILGGLTVFYEMRFEGKIRPGISVGGVDLGGLSRDEAMTLLQNRMGQIENGVYTFSYGSAPDLSAIFSPQPYMLQRTAADLGVQFDAAATVDQAFAADGSLVEQALTWFNGESYPPIIHYDQDRALAYLHQLAELIDQEPTSYNARLEYNQVVLGEGGRELDVDATFQRLNEAITSLQPTANIALVVNQLDPPGIVVNAEEAARLSEIALSGPLTLTANDAISGLPLGPWTVTVEQIEALLKVELVDNGDGTTRYDIRVDMEAFIPSLEELAPGLVARPANGRFHFDPTTRELVVIQPAINGRQINIPETLNRMEQAVFRADNRDVPIAFDYTQPAYHNNITAAELGITGLVSEATTYYTGSDANRRHNIAEGASRFDGIIIGPGEEFSFNFWVGDITLEAGFMEGKVIVGGRTVLGDGGGICQVSTTIFRAAFAGGYQIIERNSHAYRVGYYELNAPPGLDAAIWTPERDFRFQNNTDFHLLIETAIYPAQDAIQFRFYSSNPGRVVEIQEPIVRNVIDAPAPGFEANGDLQPGQIVQVDYAADGADVNVKRIIRDMQGNVLSEDNIFTHYLPWQAIYEVNPNDSRLNG